MQETDLIFGPPTPWFRPPTFETLPDFYWISHLDKFLHKHTGQLYTDDEITDLTRQNDEWLATVPNYTFREAIAIFPEAVKIARKNLKLEVKQLKERLKWLDEWRMNECQDTINKIHFKEQTFYKDWFDQSHQESRQEVERQIKKLQFSLSHLDEIDGKTKTQKTNGVSEQDVARAKEIPITHFYTDKLSKHNKLATGRCPFHNEKTGSFTIYLDQNTFWCYGCGAGGTVIDFVMRQNNCDFLQAVKTLLK